MSDYKTAYAICAGINLNLKDAMRNDHNKISQLLHEIEALRAERDWWHERAWEIDSEHEFHNGGGVLHRDNWETKQAAIREISDARTPPQTACAG